MLDHCCYFLGLLPTSTVPYADSDSNLDRPSSRPRDPSESYRCLAALIGRRISAHIVFNLGMYSVRPVCIYEFVVAAAGFIRC